MGETLEYLESNVEELGGEAAGFPTSGHLEYNKEVHTVAR